MKKNNAKRTVVVIALIALMAIPSMFAYFTDSDKATNTFTVGNVEIDLWESDGVNSYYADDATEEFKVDNIVTNQKMTKRPYVENTGSNSAYVFLEVAQGKFDLIKANGEVGVNGKWAQVPGVANVYYYTEKLAAGATTEALFDAVKFVGEEDATGDDLKVVINAYAIQSENLTEADMDKVWELVKAEEI